eukprot:COSAG02_NODE_2074_length_9929_cov_698.467955_3_plen_50_part_00
MKRVEKNEKGLGWVYLYLSVLSGVRGFGGWMIYLCFFWRKSVSILRFPF